MTLGRFVYLVWYRPIGAMTRSIREGGPIEQWMTEKGRREMEAAAWQLAGGGGGPPSPGALEGLIQNSEIENKVKRSGLNPLELHMVVGKRFWYMAAFAVVSLLKQLDRGLVVHFYSDGSLAKEQEEALGRLPVHAVIHGVEEIFNRVEKELPKEKFPNLRERLENYQNIQKLISPHIGSKGAKIVLDADVLFFKKPDELMKWQEDARGVLCTTDCMESYGYPRKVLEKLAEGKLARAVNVGITGLVSERIDWEILEKWCAELHAKHGTSYYLEQALVAMLAVKDGCNQLEKNKYITYPSETNMKDSVGTMQHYVDLSKKSYFRQMWRKIV